MLAGLQGLDGHPAVVGDGRVDVDEVDVFVRQDLLVLGVALGDAELVADGVEFLLVATADRLDAAEGMALVDGDEFGAKAQAHHRHPEFLCHDRPLLRNRTGKNHRRRTQPNFLS